MSNTHFGLRGSARFQPRAAVTAFSQPAVAPASDWLDDAVAFLFSPKGRVSRRVYRLSRLGYTAAYVALYLVGHALAHDMKVTAASHTADLSSLLYALTEALVILLAYLVVFASGVIGTIKRWHDLDRSGGWALLGFVPILGPVAQLIVFAFVRGTAGANRYGPAPR